MNNISEIKWQSTSISKDNTYHLYNNEPLYSKRFLNVLSFHTPGLAAVIDSSGAYHIDLSGNPVYLNRFVQSFGFYNGVAAVADKTGCYHIDHAGIAQYADRYSWCGNFQEEYCVVKDFDNHYFHINLTGARIYKENYKYVGDYKYGYAVVCNSFGIHSHINCKGQLLHGKWYLDLDLYHKGYARAKDSQGWMHIDLKGEPIYTKRFALVEPFYNNVARVTNFNGDIEIINTSGDTINFIKQDINNSKEEDG